jgi:Uma2 family endonuclease
MDWPAYVFWCDAMSGRRVRVTYANGEFEAMTLSPLHEKNKTLLARFVEAITEELDIDMAGIGSMTFQREDLFKGAEPDECYWIANERLIRGRETYDPRTDPPPDLVLEIEISRSALDRMAIWAAMAVPEVWRYDGKTLVFCVLTRDKNYEKRERNRALPFLRPRHLERFLRQARTMSETKLLRAFRRWVREQQAQGWNKA